MPLAAKLLQLSWRGTCWLARETLSLGRTVVRVVSPGSMPQPTQPRLEPPKAKTAPKTKTKTKAAPKTTAAAKTAPKSAATPRTKVVRTKVELKPDIKEEAIPLAGLLFPAAASDVEEESHDTVDTALQDMPVSELPGFFADTSPGTIEAPDTLPG